MNDATSERAAQPRLRPENFPHRVMEVIRLRDHDHQNHVNNAVFATYFESGRVHFMRETFGGLRFGDKSFVVARLEIDFLRELHWPGSIDVCTGVERIGRSSVTYAHATFRDDVCIATARTVMVLTDRKSRRATPMTEEVLERLRARMMR